MSCGFSLQLLPGRALLLAVCVVLLPVRALLLAVCVTLLPIRAPLLLVCAALLAVYVTLQGKAVYNRVTVGPCCSGDNNDNRRAYGGEFCLQRMPG